MERDEFQEDIDEDIKFEDTDQVHSSGENVANQNSIDRFFNTEALLYHIRMTLLGYRLMRNKYVNTGEGIATSATISKMINTLRRIINTENMLSSMDQDRINYILLENCKEQIYMILDDPTVKENDFEHIINMVDHPAEMFMGIVLSGMGSESARQILSGNYLRLTENNEQYNPALRVGTSNFDFFTIGGKRK